MGFTEQQLGVVRGCLCRSGRCVKHALQRRDIDLKALVVQGFAFAPMLQGSIQSCLLERFGCGQAQCVVKPEAHPVLQILGRTVFALGRQPFHRNGLLRSCKKRRTSATAKAYHDARFGQLSHGCLGDGGACSQQKGGCIGNWNIPV